MRDPSTSVSTTAATGGGNLAQIAPGTTMGTVRLTVSDPERTRGFYEGVVGLRAREGTDGDVVLAPPGGRDLVSVVGDPSAPALNRRATGLFHLAILVPSRGELAAAVARLAEAGWPLDGASDHLVSEALYLSDPDGNGIEIYRDRPREEWVHDGAQVRMATLALDLDDLVGERRGETTVPAELPAQTTMGHVHLQVADLRDAEAFYGGLLGFDVTVRGYPGALFLSAGGYHHHLGLNTWQSAGGSPPRSGAIGLRSYEVLLPDRPDLDRVLDRVRAVGIDPSPTADGAVELRDPSGIAVRLRAA